MKKSIFAFALALVLVGAGCFGAPRDERWTLSFALPEGWVMYGAGQGGYAGNPNAEINKQSGEIVLQSTADALVIGAPKENQVEYEGKVVKKEDFAYVRVFRLDERRLISDEAEDLGKGFFREKKCDDGGDCQENGAHNYAYFYVKGDAKYQFNIVTNGRTPDEAIEVIRSAKALPIE
jgi:hypothetical protein